MRRVIDLCKRYAMVLVVALSALLLGFAGQWHPWVERMEIPLLGNPGVGQWVVVAVVLCMVVDTVCGIIEDIRHGRVGVDLLAVIAMLSTLAVREYWAGWAVALMVVSGELIESYAQSKAEGNITALLRAAPQEAHVSTLPGIGSHVPSPSPTDAGGPNASGFRSVSAPSDSRSADRLVPAAGVLSPQPGSSSAAPSGSYGSGHGDDARFVTVPVDRVRIGDVVTVLPGERVPVDGELLSGSATLDLSAINGEPVPREVYAGARVVSGAVNGSALMVMRATALARDSQYQRIVQLVSSARDSRGAAVRAADVMAVPFTVLSLGIAAVAWAVSGMPLRFAQVLVLATPCPLLIAVPVAFVAGAGRLAKAGIVVKAQSVLESLARVSHVFFDKTGTLTVKQPQVIRVDMLPEVGDGMDEDHVLMMAGVVETYSVHILAKGIAKAGMRAYERLRGDCRPGQGKGGDGEWAAKGSFACGRGHEIPVVRNIDERAGMGISGEVDGRMVRVGRLAFANANAEGFQPVSKEGAVADGRKVAVSAGRNGAPGEGEHAHPAADAAIRGRFPALNPDEMAAYVSVDGSLVARIVLRDVPRPNAGATVRGLRGMGVGHVAMLTGDKSASARIVAAEVGIEDVRAELFPEDKVNAVRQVRDAAHGHVSGLPAWRRQWDMAFGSRRDITVMVGDGVNDAPVLAAADIGVAISDGTSTAASESAQMVVMNDDIAAVVRAVGIARRTRQVMLQSVLIGLGLALVCMVAAAFNLIPVVVGAFIQEAIDVVSILWALTVLIDRRDADAVPRAW